MGTLEIWGSTYHIQRGKLILVEGLSITGSEIIVMEPKVQAKLKRGLISVVPKKPEKPKRLHKRIVQHGKMYIGYLVDDTFNIWAKCHSKKIHLAHRKLNEFKERWIRIHRGWDEEKISYTSIATTSSLVIRENDCML